jgi:hypothetical protein
VDRGQTDDAVSDKVEIGGIVYDLSPSTWSGSRWREFLRRLTPRQRIYHVRAWQLLAQSHPELRPLVAHAIEDIRQTWEEPGDDWLGDYASRASRHFD